MFFGGITHVARTGAMSFMESKSKPPTGFPSHLATIPDVPQLTTVLTTALLPKVENIGTSARRMGIFMSRGGPNFFGIDL